MTCRRNDTVGETCVGETTETCVGEVIVGEMIDLLNNKKLNIFKI
jgi:hypothetical protein